MPSFTADHRTAVRAAQSERRAPFARATSSRKDRCCSRSTAAPGDPTANAGSVNWQNDRREYTARGVQVVAVVAQSSVVVRRYIEDTGLPFNILVDESRDVLKAYGVWHRRRARCLEHRAGRRSS